MPASAKASSSLVVTLPSDREVLLTRVFDAPRELVFEALTQPQHLRRWFGPRAWTLAVCEVDLRAGGKWRYILEGPGGRRMGMYGVFQEIAPPERVVTTEAFDEFPQQSVNTTTLSEENGRTTLTCRVVCASKEVRDAVIHSGMERGAAETYDRLSELLAAMQEFITTRVFDAPRELVFRAWTDPERLQRWWGPKGFTNPRCEVDVRPGGAIRIDMRAPDGMVYPMTGTFLEIVPAERLVFISSALDRNGEPLFEVRNTVTFAEEDGKTRLTVHAVVSKIRPEAAPHLAGMAEGWSLTLDRLVEEVRR